MARSYESPITQYFDAVLVDASAAKAPQRCSPRRIVEISKEQFDDFRKNPDKTYSFIGESTGYCRIGRLGEVNCLLVMPEGGRDGMLVLTNGSNRAEKVAYLPFARDKIQQERYYSLAEHNRKLIALVEQYATEAVRNQVEGQAVILVEQLRNNTDDSNLDEDLFIEMLSERPEIASGEWTEDAIYLDIAEEFLQMEDNSQFIPLSTTEFDIMCAKHKLWLLNSGGERADFSDRLLRDIDMAKLSLDKAIFKNAKLVNCDMTYTSLIGAVFDGARIYNCRCTWLLAPNASFRGAQIKGTDLQWGTLSQADLTDAVFRNCAADAVQMLDSCLARTTFFDMNAEAIDMSGSYFDERQWRESRIEAVNPSSELESTEQGMTMSGM